MEYVSMIANIFTAIATIVMAVVAYCALNTWRKEFIGKKKIELAAEIMETVCEIQDLLIGARLNRFSSNELKEVEDFMNSEKKRDPQNTDIYPDRFHFMVAHHRLYLEQNKIDKLRSFFNQAFIYWGKDMMLLIYELIEYTLQVRTASKKLYYNEEPQNHQNFIKMIWNEDPNDPISKRVNDIVEEFKLNLEPLYKDQQTSWKKLDSKN